MEVSVTWSAHIIICLELRAGVGAGDIFWSHLFIEVFEVTGEVTWKKSETKKRKGPSWSPEVLPHLCLGAGGGAGAAGEVGWSKHQRGLGEISCNSVWENGDDQ